jgi:two-component sensor histidine kinase
MLIGQLDGSADMDNQNGTSFHISFPFVEKG